MTAQQNVKGKERSKDERLHKGQDNRTNIPKRDGRLRSELTQHPQTVTPTNLPDPLVFTESYYRNPRKDNRQRLFTLATGRRGAIEGVGRRSAPSNSARVIYFTGTAMLSASTVRNLGQKEYEKRKSAALEIETMVRDLRDSGDYERIGQLVTQLVDDLAASPLSNVRKGALHALAGTAIGLQEDIDRYLAELLKPVLDSFSDQDPRVRYYACESLYNIAKVARSAIVKHFNNIFNGLFNLSADTDTQVQSGMQLLDRLMKDVVTECDNFDIEAFMPLLKERVYVMNPFSRQFVCGWIATLDSVPDIDLLVHLPVFLDVSVTAPTAGVQRRQRERLGSRSGRLA